MEGTLPRKYVQQKYLRGSRCGKKNPRTGTWNRKKEINKHEVIIIKPETEEKDERTNEEIKVQVLEELKDVSGKLKIKGIKQLRRKGVIIKVDNKQDVELIKETNMERRVLKVEEPRKMMPSIIIYDMEKDYKAENIKEDLIRKNFEYLDIDTEDKLRKEIVMRHSFKSKDNYVNWIVQIPSGFYGHLVDRGRIYLQWRS